MSYKGSAVTASIHRHCITSLKTIDLLLRLVRKIASVSPHGNKRLTYDLFLSTCFLGYLLVTPESNDKVIRVQ
jgi:hypothetical protein